jgi:transcriptional regulator with XRE-family HTH domain
MVADRVIGNVISHDLQQTLSKFLEERGIKNAELARILGVDPASVNGWLVGRNSISKKHITRLELIFKVPAGNKVSQYLGIEDLPKFFQSYDKISHKYHSPDEGELNLSLKNLEMVAQALATAKIVEHPKHFATLVMQSLLSCPNDQLVNIQKALDSLVIEEKYDRRLSKSAYIEKWR